MLSTISTIYDFSVGTFGTEVKICSTKKSSAMYKDCFGFLQFVGSSPFDNCWLLTNSNG